MTPDETMREAARLLRAGVVPVAEFVGALTPDAARDVILACAFRFAQALVDGKVAPTDAECFRAAMSPDQREAMVSMLVGREETWWTLENGNGRSPWLVPDYSRRSRVQVVTATGRDFFGEELTLQELARERYRPVKVLVRRAPTRRAP